MPNTNSVRIALPFVGFAYRCMYCPTPIALLFVSIAHRLRHCPLLHVVPNVNSIAHRLRYCPSSIVLRIVASIGYIYEPDPRSLCEELSAYWKCPQCAGRRGWLPRRRAAAQRRPRAVRRLPLNDGRYRSTFGLLPSGARWGDRGMSDARFVRAWLLARRKPSTCAAQRLSCWSWSGIWHSEDGCTRHFSVKT